MAMTYRSALMPMLVEIYCVCMQRYLVGFGRTESTLVSTGVRLNLNVSILGVRCIVTSSSHHRNFTLDCFSNTLQRRWHTVLRGCWLNTYIAYIYYDQAVRRYWCTFCFEFAVTWKKTIHHYTIAIAMWSCWLWTNSWHVGIGACLNLKGSSFGIPCIMTPLNLHTNLLCNYNGNGIRRLTDAHGIYGTVSCWLWTNSTGRWY